MSAVEIVKRSFHWRARLSLPSLRGSTPDLQLRRDLGEPRTFNDRTVTDDQVDPPAERHHAASRRRGRARPTRHHRSATRSTTESSGRWCGRRFFIVVLGRVLVATTPLFTDDVHRVVWHRETVAHGALDGFWGDDAGGAARSPSCGVRRRGSIPTSPARAPLPLPLPETLAAVTVATRCGPVCPSVEPRREKTEWTTRRRLISFAFFGAFFCPRQSSRPSQAWGRTSPSCSRRRRRSQPPPSRTPALHRA